MWRGGGGLQTPVVYLQEYQLDKHMGGGGVLLAVGGRVVFTTLQGGERRNEIGRYFGDVSHTCR